MLTPWFWIAPIGSVLALVVAFLFYKDMMTQSEGTPKMASIALAVRKGAMAYLKQQYKVVLIVFLCLTVLFAVMAYVLKVQNGWVPFAFITGGFFSGLAGFFGMKTATQASARTANAARHSLNKGLTLAFRSGAVMGLVVVGLALLDISAWFIILNRFYPASGGSSSLVIITTTMLTFGMGASTQALFARVGGGIFTKAADVGADLVGKVEAGIPEDDPRNPATIADNVGDNVGDVAGMGADLYESYCGAILATAALGATAFSAAGGVVQMNSVIAPMVIAGIGTMLSVIGIMLVRTREGADQKQLLGALGRGVNVSSILIVAASAVILNLLGIPNAWGVWGSLVTGLVVGTVIGKSTEYYTSHAYKPTQAIAAQSKTGAATVIISGIGTGMISTAVPVLMVSIGTIMAFLFASGFRFDNLSMGLYGIGIAAVGMLSTLGITLATDAYGPIADNAGGNAEMAGLEKEVRERTDALDALGNTTAATGKGFAIGSAALTALALLASYLEEIKMGLVRVGIEAIDVGGAFGRSRNRHACGAHGPLPDPPDEPDRPLRCIHRFNDGIPLLRPHDAGCRTRGGQHGRRGPQAVRRETRDHRGHRRARLHQMCRDLDPWSAEGNDPSRLPGNSGADPDRTDPGGRGCDGPAFRRAGSGFRACHLHGQFGRSLGQRKEVRGRGQSGRQGLRGPQGNDHWRHGGRPLQRYLGPQPQHPDKAHEHGFHRNGWSYGNVPHAVRVFITGCCRGPA